MSREELQRFIEREIRKIDTRSEDCSPVLYHILNNRSNRELLRRSLGSEAMRLWDESPHLRIHVLRNTHIPIIHVPSASGDSFMRLLPGSPVATYEKLSRNLQCPFSSIHIGQRKLLINEILFLNLHGSKSGVIVYIGAAGGYHTVALAEMFPNHKFLLYDPAPFSKQIITYARLNPKRIKIYNELFPPEEGSVSHKELLEATSGDAGFLLISDIRRRDEQEDLPSNADVDADMELQFEICRKMNPKAAHLKCRLPYLEASEADIQVRLLKGVIYIQPWAGQRSTETRLIIEPPYTDENTVTVSARWYESALFYHNLVTRFSSFIMESPTPLDFFLGTIYDTCFDCTFERHVLLQYLSSPGLPGDYSSFSAIYELIKKAIGREDDRLLK